MAYNKWNLSSNKSKLLGVVCTIEWHSYFGPWQRVLHEKFNSYTHVQKNSMIVLENL